MLNTIGPGKCEYIVTDLKDKAGCDQLAAEVKKRTDTLTVLLNNSGATWYVPCACAIKIDPYLGREIGKTGS